MHAPTLAEEGWRVLDAADPLAKRVDEKVLAAKPAQQRERFVQDLNAIVVALGQRPTPRSFYCEAIKPRSAATCG